MDLVKEEKRTEKSGVRLWRRQEDKGSEAQ